MTEEAGNNGLSKARLGLIAVRKGFITQDHLVKAMRTQVLREIEFGTHRKVGAILLNENIMTADQIEEVREGISQGIET